MMLTIGKRLSIIVLLSVFFMAAGIYFSIMTYNKLIEETTILLKDTKKSELMLKDAQLDLQWYRITHEEKYIRDFRNSIKSFKSDTEKRREHAQKIGNQELIITIESSFQKIREMEEKLERAFAKGRKDMDVIWVDLMYALPGFADDVVKFSSLEEQRIEKNILSIKTIILIIGAVIIVIVFTMSSLISRSIVSGVRKLISVITVSAKSGDLTQQVNIKSKDEMGQLASTFNALISTMLSIVKSIQSSAEKVTNQSGRFSALASNLSSSSKSITDSVQGIANGATQQFRQVGKTSSAIEVIIGSINRVALKSQNAVEKTDIARIGAKRGSDATKDPISRKQQINETVDNAAGVIRKLGNKSEQISKIVDVITKIAEQTNLLALNTAVEASRAGEAASGFAVVADEVRKLAEESARSANEITALVREIQAETYRAVNTIESGTKLVDESKVVVHNTEKALDEYMKALEEVIQLAQDISKTTQEQTESCQQVRNAVAAIEAVTEENKRATEGALLSTRGQMKLVETIVDSTHELENVSSELISTVKKFKV